MITKKQIENLVLEKIEGTSTYLVDVQVKPGNQITVEVDSIEGMKISDCVAVSRHIEGNLDRDQEDFGLQVTTPGVGNAFKVRNQYYKNINRTVSITTNEGDVLEGKLLEVEDDSLKIETPDKQNKKQKVVQEIAFNTIKETKSVISFK